MSHSAKDPRRLLRALAVCGLLLALVGGAVYWFFFRDQPLKIGRPALRERITVETDLQPAPAIADVYAPNSGFGTYWSARNIHDWEEMTLGKDMVTDWDTVEAKPFDRWIHDYFHVYGMSVRPKFYLTTMRRTFSHGLALSNWGWPVFYGSLAAEIFDTDLALELAQAWVRLAPPDQFVEAYARVGVVLGNAGRTEALEALVSFDTGQGDPMRIRPKKIPELFPIEWNAPEDTAAGLWQRHQWYLVMNDREQAGQALEALEALAADSENRDRFLRWVRDQLPAARQRYDRLGQSTREILRESHAGELPALAQVLAFYEHVAELKDYGKAVDQYDDEALFQLVEYFGQTLKPTSIEYVDLLLYSIEIRRLERWDWNIEHLIHAGPLIDRHYQKIRAHPIFRIAVAQTVHAPEMLRQNRSDEKFRLVRVNLLNRATKKIYPGHLQFRYDREAIIEIVREYQPYFEKLKDDAESLAGSIRTRGARRDFYERYFSMQILSETLEDHMDEWWRMAKEDPQDTVRSMAQARLMGYHTGIGRDPHGAVRAAEIAIFDEWDRDRERQVSNLCESVSSFKNHPEELDRFVQGMTALLDRLEAEMGEDAFDLSKPREILNQFS